MSVNVGSVVLVIQYHVSSCIYIVCNASAEVQGLVQGEIIAQIFTYGITAPEWLIVG